LPENTDLDDQDIFGNKATFCKRDYYGSLEEVKNNVARYGEIENCEFVKGWFADTLPNFSQSIAVMFLDVDLVSSARTCLKYLYPLLIQGGVLYSHDGHLVPVRNVFADERFWEDEVGCLKPQIQGLGSRVLIRIVKP
jgi:O-methyltransferase